jgi:Transposase DDE domain group 1
VHGGQHHHDERCFMPVHVYHVESGKPAVVILRTGKTPAGREERTVIKHVTRRIRRHWPKTRICWRAIFGQQSHLPYQF